MAKRKPRSDRLAEKETIRIQEHHHNTNTWGDMGFTFSTRRDALIYIQAHGKHGMKMRIIAVAWEGEVEVSTVETRTLIAATTEDTECAPDSK